MKIKVKNKNFGPHSESEYTPKKLYNMAQDYVKGKGRLLNHELCFYEATCRLILNFTYKSNDGLTINDGFIL